MHVLYKTSKDRTTKLLLSNSSLYSSLKHFILIRHEHCSVQFAMIF